MTDFRLLSESTCSRSAGSSTWDAFVYSMRMERRRDWTRFTLKLLKSWSGEPMKVAVDGDFFAGCQSAEAMTKEREERYMRDAVRMAEAVLKVDVAVLETIEED